MRSAFTKSAFIFVAFFAVGFYISQHKLQFSSPHYSSYDFASRAPNAIAVKTWALSGYLPTNVNQKVYLTIEGRIIKDINIEKPNVSYILETENLIFPGLMDMHNHIKYNVLPLWNGGQAQYLNRYEWRGYNRYKQEVTGMMKAFDKTGICAAVRWAELRALAGGTTSMQGIGNDAKCASSFGPMNVEIKGELSRLQIRAATDLIAPDAIGNVFVPKIMPQLRQYESQLESLPPAEKQIAANRYYDVALMNVLNQAGIIAWLDAFANQPRSLKLGIKLLIGEELASIVGNTQADFDAALPEIKKVLTEKYKQDEKTQIKQLDNMQKWLFGATGKPGYLSLPAPTVILKDFELLNDANSTNFLKKGGVISLDSKVRRYFNMFEIATRRSLLKYYSSPDRQAVVAHLSEGLRNDAFNKQEYNYASQLGLVQQGLVIIHGVGMDKKMFQDAAQKGVSLVWSPTSNLLLYGETLDVVEAKKAGLTIALGSDWGPSGTKSLLDELKIARQYLNKMKVSTEVISDQYLVEMATVNAAKALGLQDSVGKVEKLHLANLLLVSKNVLQKNANPYSALISAQESDIELVVVGGEPVYGEQKHIEDAARGFADTAPVELINKCQLQKAFRFPHVTKVDVEMQALQINLRSVSSLETLLSGQLAAFKTKLESTEPKLAPLVPKLDPIYPCEDTAYQNYMNNFINVTLDQYRNQRPQIRQQYKLKPNFNPMSIPVEIEGAEGEDGADTI